MRIGKINGRVSASEWSSPPGKKRLSNNPEKSYYFASWPSFNSLINRWTNSRRSIASIHQYKTIIFIIWVRVPKKKKINNCVFQRQKKGWNLTTSRHKFPVYHCRSYPGRKRLHPIPLLFYFIASSDSSRNLKHALKWHHYIFPLWKDTTVPIRISMRVIEIPKNAILAKRIEAAFTCHVLEKN